MQRGVNHFAPGEYTRGFIANTLCFRSQGRPWFRSRDVVVFAVKIKSILDILFYAYNFWAPIILVPLAAVLLANAVARSPDSNRPV